ncbi:MAG TPA: hypothetical protein VJM32_04840 [Candidatus Saccharimonadales bacterium]|nr:hypothetical protein [Candidatus Saccharimonadales bacterium]
MIWEKQEMTAPSAPTAPHNGVEGGTTIAGVVDLVVARLCPGMPRNVALRMLAQADDGDSPVAEAATRMLADAKRAEMVNHFSGIILMLERGLPASAEIGIKPYQGVLLGQAAELCLGITEPFWQCIALSLRAECLYLLAAAESNTETAATRRTDALRAASASLEIYPEPVESNPILEDRLAFCRDVIGGRMTPVTTLLFLSKLHDELVPRAATVAEAHDEDNSVLVTA